MAARSTSGDYVELHAHSAFSFLDGASQPDELAIAAAELGYGHVAVTDHDNLCGALEWGHAAVAAGVRPITGVELTVAHPLGPACHVTLLARTAEGYANIARLVTVAHAPRGQAALELAGCRAGLTSRVDAAAIASDIVRAAERGGGRDAEPRHSRSRARERGRAHGRRRERVPGRPPDVPPIPRGDPRRPEPLVTIEQLEAHAAGVTLLTGCATRGLLLPDLAAGRPNRAVDLVRRLQRSFGRAHVHVELQLPQQRGGGERARILAAAAAEARAGTVATGDVHAHTAARGRLHEVLVAIRENGSLEACEALRDGNLARVLRAPAEMVRRFSAFPGAVAATARIADAIEFDITTGLGYRYPDLADGTGRSADHVLAETCTAELERRYAGRPTLLRARARLAEELAIIRRHGLSGFFLLHRDVLELAREVAREVRGDSAARSAAPPGRGRGSSVESIVCYLTGLSHVDPLEAGLRMGRFLNDELVSLPDIDIDFPRDIRHGLLARVVERYGADRCAMVAAHATYRVRGAIRDVGSALGLPAAELARIGARTDARDAIWIADAMGPEHAGPRWDAFRDMTREIAGLPRVMGQHSGGVVIATDPLDAVVPIVPAATEGRQLVQWDKDSCADAGFLKIDVLGLGMLSAVEECVETIARSEGEVVDLSRIDLADRAVFREIRDGDTVGTFQIESRAQIQSLKRVKPENLEDLVVQVALIRPGPIIGQSVNPYVKLRERRRVDPTVQPEYDHPLLEPVLRDTYGAIIFQDQVIEVSMAIAGFTAGEADGLRRAMTRKRAAGSVEVWRPRFVAGAARRGVGEEIANRVFDKVTGFCNYGFPRAHSVSFALLAYQSAWLRHHYPAHFHAALLNAQPMGFYPPDSLLRDASRHGVRTLGVDINLSGALATVQPMARREAAARSFGRRRAGSRPVPAIRVGLGCIQGIGYHDAVALERERMAGGAFTSIDDLARRAPLRTDQLETLVMAGACDVLACEGEGRRELLWQVGLVARPHRGQAALEVAAPAAPKLAQLSIWDEVALDYRTQGLSVRAHPVELVRPLLPERVRTCDQACREVPARATIEVVGAVVARQKPGTAKGVVFLLLEDESGTLNVIVPPEVYRRERTVIRAEAMLRIVGRLERHGDVVNLLCSEVHRLPAALKQRAPKRLKAKNWG